MLRTPIPLRMPLMPKAGSPCLRNGGSRRSRRGSSSSPRTKVPAGLSRLVVRAVAGAGRETQVRRLRCARALEDLAASAQSAAFDQQGRIMVKEKLRASGAGLKKDAMLVGRLDHFQIWDKAAWDSRQTAPRDGGGGAERDRPMSVPPIFGGAARQRPARSGKERGCSDALFLSSTNGIGGGWSVVNPEGNRNMEIKIKGLVRRTIGLRIRGGKRRGGPDHRLLGGEAGASAMPLNWWV